MAGLAPYQDGIPEVASATDRETRFPLSSRLPHQRVFRLDTGNQERWSGSVWLVDFETPTAPGGGRNVPSVTQYLVNNAVFNVKDFGALGNGTTDDTASIQNTFTAAGSANGRVHFPVGTYKITDTIPLSAGLSYHITGDGDGSVILGFATVGQGTLSWWFGATNLTGTRVRFDSLVFDGTNIATNIYTNANQGTKTPIVCWGVDQNNMMEELVVTNCIFRNLQNQYQPAQRNDGIDPTSANYWNKGSGGMNLMFINKLLISGCRFETVWSWPILAKNILQGTITGNVAHNCFNAFVGVAGGSYTVTGNVCKNTGTFGLDVGESGEVLQSTDIVATGNSFQSMAWYYGVVRIQGAVNYTISGNVLDLIPVSSVIYPFYTARRNADSSAVNQTDAVLISVKQPATAPAGVVSNMVCAGNTINISDVIQHGIYVYLDGVSSGQVSGVLIHSNVIGHVVADNTQAITRAYIRVQRSASTFSCFGISIQGNLCTTRYAPSLDTTQTNANDRPLMIGGGSSSGSTANLSGLSIVGNLMNPVAADSGTLTKEFLNIDSYTADVVISGNNCVVFLHKPLYTPSTAYITDMNFGEAAFAPTQGSLVAGSSILPIAQNIPISCTSPFTFSGEVVVRSGQKDGKLVRLTNVSANNITLTSGTSPYGLSLMSPTLVLASGATITLVYDLIFNYWREVARTAGAALLAPSLTTTAGVTVGNALIVSAGGITSSGSTVLTGSLVASGGFGVNGATAQTAFASGGAAPAGGTGATAGAYDTSAHRDALITLVNNMRTALVNAGLMS